MKYLSEKELCVSLEREEASIYTYIYLWQDLYFFSFGVHHVCNAHVPRLKMCICHSILV